MVSVFYRGTGFKSLLAPLATINQGLLATLLFPLLLALLSKATSSERKVKNYSQNIFFQQLIYSLKNAVYQIILSKRKKIIHFGNSDTGHTDVPVALHFWIICIKTHRAKSFRFTKLLEEEVVVMKPSPIPLPNSCQGSIWETLIRIFWGVALSISSVGFVLHCTKS